MNSGKLIFGLILIFAFLFLTISLCGYSPLDSPTGAFFPKPERAYNYCGLPGAYCSATILSLFGFAGFLVPIPLGLSLIFYWKKDGLDRPVLRTVGAFFILGSLSGASSFLLDQSSLGPLIGSGGYLGAILRFYLSQHFAQLGCLIFLASFFVAGTILVGDFTLIRFLIGILGIYAISDIILGWFGRSNKKRNRVPTISAKNAGGFVSASFEPTSRRNGFNGSDGFYFDSVSTDGLSSGDGSIPDRLDAAKNFERYAEARENDVENRRTASDDRLNARPAVVLNEFAATSSPKPEYRYPPIDLLNEKEEYDQSVVADKVLSRAVQLEKAFKSYKLDVKVVDTQTGPVLTLFEISLAEGLRVKNIHALTRDLEIAMKVPSVRIVSPIPGKGTVGVELPNTDRQLVRLREVMEESVAEAEKMEVPVFLGKDVIGAPMIADLAKLPHLLIAGRTGTGKSVCLNSIIMSILMTRRPDEVRLIMIDPKMVELSPYKTIPHLMHPVVVDMKKAEAILEWAVEKMEQRYLILSQAGVNQITKYNKLSPETLRKRMKPQSDEEWAAVPKSMPYIVIVADEMADLMMTAGKEVERHIIRLAQKSRAVGIHLVLATQKPTVDVLTGLIKSNLPARIAFGVATRTDSQVVLDCKGAEQLLGNGDMLFLQPGTSQVVRGQGTFVSDKEIDAIISEIGVDESEVVSEIDFSEDEDANDDDWIPELKKDNYYEAAVEVVFQKGQASISFLQRKFSVGYNRAAKMVEMMEAEGIVSPPDRYKPSKPRDLLITYEQWLQQNDQNGGFDDGSFEEGSPGVAPRTPVPVSRASFAADGSNPVSQTNATVSPGNRNNAVPNRQDSAFQRGQATGRFQNERNGNFENRRNDAYSNRSQNELLFGDSNNFSSAGSNELTDSNVSDRSRRSSRPDGRAAISRSDGRNGDGRENGGRYRSDSNNGDGRQRYSNDDWDDDRFDSEAELDEFLDDQSDSAIDFVETDDFDEFEDKFVDEYLDDEDDPRNRNASRRTKPSKNSPKTKSKRRGFDEGRSERDSTEPASQGWSDEDWEKYYDSWDEQNAGRFDVSASDESPSYNMRDKAKERRDKKRNDWNRR